MCVEQIHREIYWFDDDQVLMETHHDLAVHHDILITFLYTHRQAAQAAHRHIILLRQDRHLSLNRWLARSRLAF